MTTDLTKTTTPEEEELQTRKDELERLSALVAEKELELADLKRSVARFEQRYYLEVGKRYMELDDLHAQIAELRAQHHPHDPDSTSQARAARQKAIETANEYHQMERAPEYLQDASEPSPETKALYKKIALLIHPDRAPDERSKQIREKLCKELNAAYDRNDVRRMQAILEEWQHSPETVSGDGIGMDLVRVIRAIAQVKKRIAAIETELSEIRESEVYQGMVKVLVAESAGRDRLRDIAQALDAEILQAKKELKAMRL